MAKGCSSKLRERMAGNSKMFFRALRRPTRSHSPARAAANPRMRADALPRRYLLGFGRLHVHARLPDLPALDGAPVTRREFVHRAVLAILATPAQPHRGEDFAKVAIKLADDTEAALGGADAAWDHDYATCSSHGIVRRLEIIEDHYWKHLRIHAGPEERHDR